MTTPRWERRDRKLKARRQAMRVSGLGLKKVTLPLLRQKARKAQDFKRTTRQKRRPLASFRRGPVGLAPRRETLGDGLR